MECNCSSNRKKCVDICRELPNFLLKLLYHLPSNSVREGSCNLTSYQHLLLLGFEATAILVDMDRYLIAGNA